MCAPSPSSSSSPSSPPLFYYSNCARLLRNARNMAAHATPSSQALALIAYEELLVLGSHVLLFTIDPSRIPSNDARWAAFPDMYRHALRLFLERQSDLSLPIVCGAFAALGRNDLLAQTQRDGILRAASRGPVSFSPTPQVTASTSLSPSPTPSPSPSPSPSPTPSPSASPSLSFFSFSLCSHCLSRFTFPFLDSFSFPFYFFC
jgi:hypothetical protein